MYAHASAAITAALFGGGIADDAFDMPNLVSLPQSPTKLSVGDKAHRAFNKTKLYSPNGKRECARRARQNASKAAA